MHTRVYGPQLMFLESWYPEVLLREWKQQLDRDIETLNSLLNIVSIHAVSISS